MMVLALVGAALPALAGNHPTERVRDEAGREVRTDHPQATTFALTSAGGPAKKGNYKAAAEPPTAKQLEASGNRGGNR
jgi:hypothetical protein